MTSAKGTVFITGSSAGLGVSFARAFALGGYGVILHGRDGKKLRVIQEKILKESQFNCPIVVGDLRTDEGIRAVKNAFREHGVSILINNAAINPELGGDIPLPQEKDIEDIISTNAISAIALCYEAFECFKASSGGTIININSVAGLRGSPKESLYAASKFALRGFSESVKEEWLKAGVRVIDAYPGAIGIGMSAGRPDKENLIDPKEFAEFIVALCATKSFFVKELNIRRAVV
jgi:short-subunit dehydrogenase